MHVCVWAEGGTVNMGNLICVGGMVMDSCGEGCVVYAHKHSMAECNNLRCLLGGLRLLAASA